MMRKIALVDDHTLLRRGLANLVEDHGHIVVFEARNGKEMIQLLSPATMPDIILLDIHMPVMDGYETAAWLKAHHPDVKVLALSMYDDETSVIRMIKNGARGYILKDSDPSELKNALHALETKDYYHSEMVSARLVHTLNQTNNQGAALTKTLGLNDRELEFLKLACTELTYKEIAEKMFLSPRTIDGYRDALFEKLEIKTRVGLVLFAIKNGIVKV